MLYRVWQGIHQRCGNPRSSDYWHYGERGISVCDEWDDFVPFRDWAIANGYDEGLSLDRIDIDGNYEPGNCEWVPLWENTRRQKGSKLLPADVRIIRQRISEGETQLAIAHSYGVSKATIQKIHVGRSWAHVT